VFSYQKRFIIRLHRIALLKGHKVGYRFKRILYAEWWKWAVSRQSSKIDLGGVSGDQAPFNKSLLYNGNRAKGDV